MSRFLRHPLDGGHPPDWATAWGEDERGIFVAFEVAGVEQRMRWIRPGRFMMGSTQAEAGRDDDELQHEVIITKGFWLGETPCTQALWQAVMDDNPSRFKSPQRPVEQVSFEDVARFLQRLGQQQPNLDMRLPSEAEWEYACRAGTKEATYAGNLTLRGDGDAPELDAIAWYSGNSGVDYDLEESEPSAKWPGKQYEHSEAGSRIVGQKLPNPWGLGDMLGNVWEWCEDWYAPYEQGSIEDPVGPDQGTRRVYRGGSWSANARSVRAAYRLRDGPSNRWFNLGFRLARG